MSGQLSPSAAPERDRPEDLEQCHPTVLDQDIQALLDEQVVVENDQAERKRKYVVASSDLKELADTPLFAQTLAL